MTTDSSGRRPTRRGFLGATGAATGVAATAAIPSLAQEGVDYGGWFDGVSNFDGTVDRTGESEVTVTVGSDANGGPYGFGPAAVRVDPGTTVTFDWASDTHNVVVDSQPDGAGWEGHAAIENTGFSFSHTFEAEGVYTYFCEPHQSMGMKGAIVVGDAGGAAGGGVEPTGPIRWTPTAIAGGVALGLAAVAPVVTALYMWSNQREDRRDETDEVAANGAVGSAGTAATTAVEEAAAYEPERHVGHDEFDPVGTLSLILVYLAILVVMWVFVYFFEFLGNGPTIIG